MFEVGAYLQESKASYLKLKKLFNLKPYQLLGIQAPTVTKINDND